MTSDTKMLQLVLDGQRSIHDEVGSVKTEITKGFGEVGKQIKKTNTRLDKLELQIARLEDDSPTISEFEDLEQKVTKIQKHLALN